MAQEALPEDLETVYYDTRVTGTKERLRRKDATSLLFQPSHEQE